MKTKDFDQAVRDARNILLRHLCTSYGSQSCECYPRTCSCPHCRAAQVALTNIRRKVDSALLCLEAPDPRDRKLAVSHAEQVALYTSFFMLEPNPATRFMEAVVSRVNAGGGR